MNSDINLPTSVLSTKRHHVLPRSQ